MKTKEELNSIIKGSKLNELSQMNISKSFGQSLARLRTLENLTQQDLATILGISKNTLIRLETGETDKIDLTIAVKASVLFKAPIREMCGYLTHDITLYYDLTHSTKRTQRLIYSILSVDAELMENMQNYLPDKKYLIDCMKSADDLRDGIPCNRFYHDCENISRFRNYSWFKWADVMLEVNSNNYHPLYHIGDKLVISCRTPRNGDVGIFIRDACFFMRKYIVDGDNVYLNYVSLEENEKNEYFRVNRYRSEEMNRWVKFGTVVAII